MPGLTEDKSGCMILHAPKFVTVFFAVTKVLLVSSVLFDLTTPNNDVQSLLVLTVLPRCYSTDAGRTLQRRRMAAGGNLAELCLRGDRVVKTKETLTVVRARTKCVLISSNIENATLCSLAWTQVANFLSKIFCSYITAFCSYITSRYWWRATSCSGWTKPRRKRRRRHTSNSLDN